MKLESRIKKIEDQLSSKSQDNGFTDWTREELYTYAITGILPVGKTLPKLSKEDLRRFAGWTKEELVRYALTGVKPEKVNMNAAM